MPAVYLGAEVVERAFQFDGRKSLNKRITNTLQNSSILIAHRLSTVRNCDRVMLLEKGQITAAGDFEELEGKSERFRKMATQ